MSRNLTNCKICTSRPIQTRSSSRTGCWPEPATAPRSGPSRGPRRDTPRPRLGLTEKCLVDAGVFGPAFGVPSAGTPPPSLPAASLFVASSGRPASAVLPSPAGIRASTAGARGTWRAGCRRRGWALFPPELHLPPRRRVILLESMGIPLPGEIILVSASLLAATGSPAGAWRAAASIGAIVGDSIGYAIGRRGGRPLLQRFGRRFPKHSARSTWHGPRGSSRNGASGPCSSAGSWRCCGSWPAAGRRAARAVPEVPRGQRGRRHRLGVRHDVRDLLPRRGRREVAEGLLLRRPDRRDPFGIGTTLYLRHRAARAKVLLDDDDPTTNPRRSSDRRGRGRRRAAVSC